MKLSVGSLFSGIGGMEIGLERTGGFETIWFCENEPYCREVLNKNFPNIPVLGDITKVDWNEVEKPDVVAGGFPCQDISVAGKGAGIKEGTRSGLWKEYARAVRALRPRYALVENVSMLAARGLDIVLADLAEMGYDAEWGIISAAEVGAPHRRERLFIIAHAAGERCGQGCGNRAGGQVLPLEKREAAKGEPQGHGWLPRAYEGTEIDAANSNHSHSGLWRDKCSKKDGIDNQTFNASEFGSKRVQGCSKSRNAHEVGQGWSRGSENCAPEFRIFRSIRRIEELQGRTDIPEPLLRRSLNGLPSRLDSYRWRERIKSLGNSVVPAVAEKVGRIILEMEKHGQ